MLQSVILSRPLWQEWLLPQRQEEGYNFARPKGQDLSFLSLKKQTYMVCGRKEGRKEGLLMRATNEVDWHVNVWSEQISGPQIYQGKQ